MKILHVSATDLIGGAGIAAYRLHQGLNQLGVDSQMLVYKKSSSDDKVHRLLPRMNRWNRLRVRYAMRSNNRQLKANPRKTDAAYWSLNSQYHAIAQKINQFKVDIVHLHWIGDNYLPIQAFAQIDTPIVWTLHDMWALTGGCHYSGECTRYESTCGNCPQLINPAQYDISYQVFQQKAASWATIPMTIVTPSQWLANCVKASPIFRDKVVQVIPNGIDTHQFKPIDQSAARTAFNLPQDKKLVLFGAFGGADDPRKGFHYLREALHILAKGHDSNIELVMFGADKPKAVDIPLPIHHIGRLQDTVSLALLYSACDVFIMPSLQEAFGQVALEAMACGTPCVGFNVDSIADLILHQQTGYLAQDLSAESLSNAIQWVLENSQSLGLRQKARQTVESNFSTSGTATSYNQVYQSLP